MWANYILLRNHGYYRTVITEVGNGQWTEVTFSPEGQIDSPPQVHTMTHGEMARYIWNEYAGCVVEENTTDVLEIPEKGYKVQSLAEKVE